MRVTSNTFPDSLLDQLGQLTSRQNRLQQQAATGQRISLPEDDPAAVRRILDLQVEAKQGDQYGRNIARLQELATASFSAMKGLKKIVDRAGELATRADSLKSPAELSAMSAEVAEMIKQALQWVNTRNRGDALFGGTATVGDAFAATTDSSGKITAVAYQGNVTAPESEIAEGSTVSAHVPGANSSGAGPRGLVADSRTGADLFAHLISLRDQLASGNVAAIQSTTRDGLAKDEENFLIQYGGNGALQGRLEATAALHKERGTTVEGLISKDADADLAQTLVRLNETQTAYRAALQSAGNILSTSLLDFLH